MNIRTVFLAYKKAAELEAKAHANVRAMQAVGVEVNTIDAGEFDRKILEQFKREYFKRLRQTYAFRTWLMRENMVASPPWYAYTEGTLEYAELEKLKQGAARWRYIEVYLRNYSKTFAALMNASEDERAEAIWQLMQSRDVLTKHVQEFALLHFPFEG